MRCVDLVQAITLLLRAVFASSVNRFLAVNATFQPNWGEYRPHLLDSIGPPP
jgi:hypothetical protein